MIHSKKQVKSGFIWSALDSVVSQGIGLLISLTLANVLGPSDYGLVAMLTIFIAVAGVFVNSGFSSALIRKTDRSEKDYSTTFYFSFGISLLLYSVLFILAPVISNFYEQPELTLLTRFVASTIVINTFSVIPKVKLTVMLDFKKQAKANVIALVIGGIVGLTMAFNGFGVWSLVGQQILSAIISVFVLNILSPWKPVEPFCKDAFKELFNFGSKLLVSGILDTVYNNLYTLIIGKQFNTIQLGLFNQANLLSSMPATTITSVIQRVTYPILSELQGNSKTLDEAYLIILKIATMIVFPIMFGISIVSQPMIDLLLGESWKGSSLMLSILSMAFVLYPIHAINLNLLQVKGRSDIFLKLEFIKKINITIVIFITIPMGVIAMCIGVVINSYLALIINTYYTSKFSGITQKKQLASLLPIISITLISSIIGYETGKMFHENIQIIIVSLTASLFIYLFMMAVFQKNLLIEVKNLFKGT